MRILELEALRRPDIEFARDDEGEMATSVYDLVEPNRWERGSTERRGRRVRQFALFGGRWNGRGFRKMEIRTISRYSKPNSAFGWACLRNQRISQTTYGAIKWTPAICDPEGRLPFIPEESR